MRRALAGACAVLLAACAGILGLRPERTTGVFPHRAHVVAGATCTDCHAGVASSGDTDPIELPGDASCAKCHAKPHDTRPCLGCHGDPYVALETAEARDHLRFSHAGHQQATSGNCARCHVGVKAADRKLRPAMAVCLRCHEHEPEFRERTCDACHVDLTEEGTLPESHLAHDADFLREHGTRAASAGDLCQSCHRETFCASCHGTSVPALPSQLEFDDPSRASAHRAGFESRHAVEAAAQPGLCSSCHEPETCVSCHARKRRSATVDDPVSPHPRGWVGLTGSENEHGRAARRDPASCASCHGGAGEMLCVGCHKVGGVGGSVHPPGWTSRQSLADLSCRLCHDGAP